MNNFKIILESKIEDFSHEVYRVCRGFPRDELFITTAQLKRASLSVLLNYAEGYARFRVNVQRNFLEIAYGSLQETKRLIKFSYVENFMTAESYQKLYNNSDEIGKMLWTEIQNTNKNN